MNAAATVRIAPARLPATPRLPLPTHYAHTVLRDETEHCVPTSELVSRLVDALLANYSLSEWEEQVAHQLLFGRSCDAVGRRLGIRETTVHKHLHRIYQKTGTDTRRGLFDLALRLAAHASIAPATTWVCSSRRAAA